MNTVDRFRYPQPIASIAAIRQCDLTAASAEDQDRELAEFDARLQNWAAQLDRINGGGPPVVSVEVPVFKGGWIVPCVESVLYQSCTNWVISLRWDGGDDLSRRVLEQLDRLRHPRIRVHFGENRGIAYNRRFLTEHSQSDYVLPLDDDDMLAPHAVEAFLAFAVERPWSGIVRAKRDFIDEVGKPVQSDPWFPFEPRRFQFGAVTDVFNHSQPTLMSRAAYEKTAGWEGFADFRSAGEDCDIFIKIEEVAPIELLDDILYYYRLSDRRTSLVITDTAAFEMWRRLADKAVERLALPVKRISDRPPFVYERLARPRPTSDSVQFVINESAEKTLRASGIAGGAIRVVPDGQSLTGWTAALRDSRMPVLCCVARDVTIDGVETLDQLLDILYEYDADAVGPQIVSPMGTTLSGLPSFGADRLPISTQDPERSDQPASAAWLPSGLWLARREVIAATGGFDDQYGVGVLADADLWLRVRQRNFHCMYAGGVRVTRHDTTPDELNEGESDRFLRKWSDYGWLFEPIHSRPTTVLARDGRLVR